MVTPLIAHDLLIGQIAACPAARPRLAVPTAMGDLQTSYSADSALAHPEPAALDGSLFYPDAFADLRPALGDPVQLGADVVDLGQRAHLFGGYVESVESTPWPPANRPGLADPTPDSELALIQNTRAIDPAATGWTIALDVLPDDTVQPVLEGAGNLVRAALPDTWETGLDQFVTVTLPPFHLPYGQEFFLTLGVTCSSAYLDHAGFDPVVSVLHDGAEDTPQQTRPDGTPGYADGNDLAVRFIAPALPWTSRGQAMTVQIRTPTGGAGMVFKVAGVSVWAVPAGRDPATWWRSRPFPAGSMVRVEAQDTTARANRARIGFLPALSRPVFEAVQGLNEAQDAIFFEATDVSTGNPTDFDEMVGPIDADNRSPLELFRLYVAAQGRSAIAYHRIWHDVIRGGHPQIQAARPPRYSTTLAVDGAGVLTADEDESVPLLPAGIIRDTPRRMAQEDMANQLALTYRSVPNLSSMDHTDLDHTITAPVSVRDYGPQAIKLDTLLTVVEGQPVAGPAVDRARQALSAQSQPFTRLADGVQIVLSQLPAAGVADVAMLFDPFLSFGALVHLAGAPAELGRYHRITGAAAALGQDPTLTLELEPAYYSGAIPVSFAQLRALTPGHPVREAGVAGSTLTATDLRSISVPDDI